MSESATRKSRLTSALQSILDEGVKAGTPGLSACISSSKGKIWTSTAGLSNLTANAPMETTHLLGIGSITKVFITVVILQLIESGNLKLSSTVGEFLSKEVLEGIDNANDATIASLLSHTSGIDSWEDDPIWIKEGRGERLDPRKIWGKEEPLSYIRRPNPSGPKPGVFEYSNTNFTLLGLIIEKITGNTAESEVRNRIFEKLGMQDTFLEGFEDVPAGRVCPRYHWATDTFKESAGINPAFPYAPGRIDIIDASTSNLSVEWTAGGLLSTPSDLTTFALSLPSLLSPSSWETMQAWQPARAEPRMEIGHGLFRYSSQKYGKWFAHFGGVLGFTAIWLWKEGGDCAVCVIANAGTMHCGSVPTGAGTIVIGTEFLGLALELAGLD